MASEERKIPAHFGSAGHYQVEDMDLDDSANTGCKGTTDSSRDRIPSRLLLARAKISARLDPLASLDPAYCDQSSIGSARARTITDL